MTADPDQFVTAKAAACAHCHAARGENDHVLHGRYDKIDLPPVRPVVTRVERYARLCPCCGKTHAGACARQPALDPIGGMDEGSPFSPGVLATALYLRHLWSINPPYPRSYARLRRD